jgi:hypothetical protein
MSRVSQRELTNSPWPRPALESIATWRVEPSFARICLVPAEGLASREPFQDAGDDVGVGVKLGDVVADILVLGIPEELVGGAAGTKDRPIRSDPLDADCCVLKEVAKRLEFVLLGGRDRATQTLRQRVSRQIETPFVS